MEQLLNEIQVAFLDGEINKLLATIPEDCPSGDFSVHYNQGEELFLRLAEDFVVPRFPIHHNPKIPTPEASYIIPLRDLVRRLAARLPAAFQGLSYYFDPNLIQSPSFFRLYKVEDQVYLYILSLDLTYRPFESRLLEAGTNDETPVYKTKHLYISSEIVPLESVTWRDGRATAFTIRQLISNTWIGETGRGYKERGIWQDNDLSKFFSRLVLPEGIKVYPFYPLFCKYKTICASAPFLRPDYRRRVLPLLHRFIRQLGPEMGRIQDSLKTGDFSEKMPLFTELRGKIPQPWKEVFRGHVSRPYLNEREQKEFSLEVPDR